LFSNEAATAGLNVNLDIGLQGKNNLVAGLSSRRNMSHLMLSPRGLSVQNQLQLQVMEQKRRHQERLEQEQLEQAQMNRAETITRLVVAMQQEQYLSNNAFAIEQNRNQNVDRWRLEMRTIEQLNNAQHGHFTPSVAIQPMSVPVNANSNFMLEPDVSQAILQLNQSGVLPRNQALGIRVPQQTLNDNISMSVFQPQQHYPSFLHATLQTTDRTLNRSILAAAPSMNTRYNVPNVAALTVHGFNPSLIPLALPVILGQLDVPGDNLSEHQRFLRQQIEIFEANVEDVATHMRGRNKCISFGQVGLRCMHCAHISVKERQKGSTYYPSTKSGIYQAAQNMSATHITNGVCHYIPGSVTIEFENIQQKKQNSIAYQKTGSGRQYWIQSASQLGLVDTEDHGIRFARHWP
jgi:hypothetical protein